MKEQKNSNVTNGYPAVIEFKKSGNMINPSQDISPTYELPYSNAWIQVGVSYRM